MVTFSTGCVAQMDAWASNSGNWADPPHVIQPVIPSCAACRFWTKSDDSCRRHAPTTRANLRRIYPETSADEWCGDFEAKP